MNEPDSNLPIIKLNYANHFYSGIVGSYCWNDICVDKGLPKDISNLSMITIKHGKNISFIVEGTTRNIDTFNISIYDEKEKLFDKNGRQITLDTNGLFLIHVIGIWKGMGDVTYLFPVKVI